jgi:hypothetical protein
MTERQPDERSWDAVVRREWWVPLVVVLIGASLALAFASRPGTPMYEAEAVIAIDSSFLQKYPDLPRPDHVMQEAQKDSVVARVAEASGVATEALKAGLAVYTLDDPQSRLVVRFRSRNESEAVQAATAAATVLAERAIEMGGAEIRALEQRIEDTDKSLTAVRAIDNRTSGRRTAELSLDIVATQWQMRMKLYEDKLALRQMRSTYYYNGNVSAKDVAPARRRGSSVATASLLGLVLGLVAAAVREAMWLKATNGSAARA